MGEVSSAARGTRAVSPCRKAAVCTAALGKTPAAGALILDWGLGDNRLQVMNVFNNQEKTPFLLPIRSPETKPL
jgi:hypothetical protein